MATVTDGYCKLNELKGRLDIDADDTDDDEKLSSIINAVSRALDNHCGDKFHAETETRYYTPTCSDMIFVDNLLSVTTLKTDDAGDRTYENTWATTDYILLPENAATDNRPYTMIEVDPYGSYTFPTGVRKGVEIAGSFGFWTSTPAPVREVCLQIGEQIWTRKDAVFGMISSPSGEQIMRVAANLLNDDPHLKFMLAGYVRLT